MSSKNDIDVINDTVVNNDSVETDFEPEIPEQRSIFKFINRPWVQVWIISFVAFCCPGMYNALSGMGGSGQVDPTIAANASVALLSTGAATGVFICGPLVTLIGPKWSLAIGSWAYALYSGGLLNYNHRQNGAFVIASGAILGFCANLLWLPQGMIMTSYVKEEARGRAIALFWVVFNLGGGIGALATFGLNYNSTSGTVNDSTYIAYMVIMLVGWIVAALFICNPSQLSSKFHGERVNKINQQHKEFLSFSKLKDTAIFTIKTLMNWRLLCILPMFFNANIFYAYQQNYVNALTFNIRTRALNSSLYWIAQMSGGFLIGMILDLKFFKRNVRVVVGWAILFILGMVIWGGGYKFQVWSDARIALGLKQDIDFKGDNYIGPMFLYFFYGMYDALFQSYCYWMIGVFAKTPSESAILVGTYKTLQCVGGAMAWKVNAIKTPAMTQFAMNWGLTCGTLVIALPCVISFFREEQKQISLKDESEEKSDL